MATESSERLTPTPGLDCLAALSGYQRDRLTSDPDRLIGALGSVAQQIAAVGRDLLSDDEEARAAAERRRSHMLAIIGRTQAAPRPDWREWVENFIDRAAAALAAD